MIFSKESIQAIVDGKKTQTRRIVKEKEYATTTVNIDLMIRVKKGLRVKWEIGRMYAVCAGRGVKQYETIKGASRKPLWIRIVGLKKQNLLDISKEEIIKEGYPDALSFFSAFRQVNKLKEIKSNPKVWVISFEVIGK